MNNLNLGFIGIGFMGLSLVKRLSNLGYMRILVEGGAKLSASLLNKNLIVSKENNINDKVKDKTIIKDKIGRNDPCPLGCGIKYKKCGIDNRCKKISETN